MKDIDKLPADIYRLLESDSHLELDDGGLFGKAVQAHMDSALARRDKERKPKRLWASELGDPCTRRLYYKLKHPHLSDPLPGNVLYKFFYGNVVEEATLMLARAAGHSVECEQIGVRAVYDDWTISGRLDAVIDGHIVDVKSATTRSFDKYTSGPMTLDDDPFGYLFQLGFYEHFSGLSTNRQPAFLFVDRTLGHILVKRDLEIPTKDEILRKVEHIVSSLELGDEELPERGFEAVPFQKSGNMQIPMPCRYCAYKDTCWSDANDGAGLKGYAYSTGPVWLTEIKREPKAPPIGKVETRPS